MNGELLIYVAVGLVTLLAIGGSLVVALRRAGATEAVGSRERFAASMAAPVADSSPEEPAVKWARLKGFLKSFDENPTRYRWMALPLAYVAIHLVMAGFFPETYDVYYNLKGYWYSHIGFVGGLIMLNMKSWVAKTFGVILIGLCALWIHNQLPESAPREADIPVVTPREHRAQRMEIVLPADRSPIRINIPNGMGLCYEQPSLGQVEMWIMGDEARKTIYWVQAARDGFYVYMVSKLYQSAVRVNVHLAQSYEQCGFPGQ